jgi:hypothetical protein
MLIKHSKHRDFSHLPIAKDRTKATPKPTKTVQLTSAWKISKFSIITPRRMYSVAAEALLAEAMLHAQVFG